MSYLDVLKGRRVNGRYIVGELDIVTGVRTGT
jgi:hypothetical protein